MKHPLEISPVIARRAAITKQRLAGTRPAAGPGGILEVARDLGCLQLDPISAVARTHLLVLWSRLGVYDPSDLHKLQWEERALFEYWAHAASIVLTEDYPIHSLMMRQWASGGSSWARRVGSWMLENTALRVHILSEFRNRGPLMSRDLEDISEQGWRSSGWTNKRNVSRMLDFLWTQGEILVSGRRGGQKVWDLAERFLPDWTPREELDEHEVVRQAAQRSLRALGVANSGHIAQHFIRGRYPHLEQALRELEAEGRIVRIEISGEGSDWKGPWYAHVEDVPLIERLIDGEWEPRTTLLSPFDNLICDRARTEMMFGFRFRIEIYVPKAQRQYGYYVLSILHGDRLIGRIDPLMDRKRKVLNINAVHAEPDAPSDEATSRAIAGAIESLGAFLGAREILYSERVPDQWRGALR